MLPCLDMNHIEFMRFLNAQDNTDTRNKPVTRLYKNSQSADVMIHLPQCYWEIADWLEARGDIDFGHWVIHCEQTPFEDWSLSQLLMYWLWLDLCRRHRYGEPAATAVPPEGYEPYGERANDG